MNKITPKEFAQRRKGLMDQIGDDAIAIIPSSELLIRNRDAEFVFRQDSDFLYLTGFNEPDALLVLLRSEQGKAESILFSLPKDPLHEIWQGRRIGQFKAVQDYGVDESFEVDEIDSILPD